ncbi:hypothetical protein COOONC_01878 [Cooperia oncophora]
MINTKDRCIVNNSDSSSYICDTPQMVQNKYNLVMVYRRNGMQSDSARVAGCHQSAVSKVLMDSVEALNANAGQRAFFRRYRLLGIVGVIDGTHCRIQRLTEAEEDYVCRKGYYSVNVGIVVEHDMKVVRFRPRFASVQNLRDTWAASYKAAERSPIRRLCLRVGDVPAQVGQQPTKRARYSMRVSSVIQFQSHPSERRYNRTVCSARTCVEQAFGVLKRQFHILHGECRYSPEKAAQIVVACSVFRNVAINTRKPPDYDHYLGEDRQEARCRPNRQTNLLIEGPTPLCRK